MREHRFAGPRSNPFHETIAGPPTYFLVRLYAPAPMLDLNHDCPYHPSWLLSFLVFNRTMRQPKPQQCTIRPSPALKKSHNSAFHISTSFHNLSIPCHGSLDSSAQSPPSPVSSFPPLPFLPNHPPESNRKILPKPDIFRIRRCPYWSYPPPEFFPGLRKDSVLTLSCTPPEFFLALRKEVPRS